MYEGVTYGFSGVGRTISSLKLALLSEFGIHPENQVLTSDGNIITGEFTPSAEPTPLA